MNRLNCSVTVVVVRHFRDWLLCRNACRSSLAASQSWLSSYLSQCEADLRRSLASQRVRSIEI